MVKLFILFFFLQESFIDADLFINGKNKHFRNVKNQNYPTVPSRVETNQKILLFDCLTAFTFHGCLVIYRWLIRKVILLKQNSFCQKLMQ